VAKKRIAVFTATGCRVCESVLLDLHYTVNPLTRWADIVFWPYVSGNSRDELEKLDGVDVCFFAGAVRTEADRRAASKLREKSEIVTALGACAAFGGMPGLANLCMVEGEEKEESSPLSSDSFPPPLPGREPCVRALPQVVETDYFIAGCPPTPPLTWAAVQSLLGGEDRQNILAFATSRLPGNVAEAVASGALPPRGTVFAGEKAVCASCSRIKEKKRFKELRKSRDRDADPSRCLLEQGVFCQGIVTREGCGGLCTAAGVPCRGCFGKAEAVYDPGARMVSAVASTFETLDPLEVEKIVGDFDDLAGTLYRYTLPSQCVLRCPPPLEGREGATCKP